MNTDLVDVDWDLVDWLGSFRRKGYVRWFIGRPSSRDAWRNPANLVEGLLQPDHVWDRPAAPGVFHYMTDERR